MFIEVYFRCYWSLKEWGFIWDFICKGFWGMNRRLLGGGYFRKSKRVFLDVW